MTEYYYKDTPRYMRSRILTRRHRCFYALHLSCALELSRTLRSLQIMGDAGSNRVANVNDWPAAFTHALADFVLAWQERGEEDAPAGARVQGLWHDDVKAMKSSMPGALLELMSGEYLQVMATAMPLSVADRLIWLYENSVPCRLWRLLTFLHGSDALHMLACSGRPVYSSAWFRFMPSASTVVTLSVAALVEMSVHS